MSNITTMATTTPTKTLRALRELYAALTHRYRFSADDALIDKQDARQHRAIDFTGAQLRRIGIALREAELVLDESDRQD